MRCRHAGGCSTHCRIASAQHAGQVSADVLQKVMDAVQRTSYVPNCTAGGLASSRSRLIAAVLPSTVMSVVMETVESLNNTLFDAVYQAMLGRSGYSIDRKESLIEAMISRRPDGKFLAGIVAPGQGRARRWAARIPVVESWDLTPTPIDMLIGFSHADTGREVANFLVTKGRQRLALVRADDERAERRVIAFSKALSPLDVVIW